MPLDKLLALSEPQFSDLQDRRLAKLVHEGCSSCTPDDKVPKSIVSSGKPQGGNGREGGRPNLGSTFIPMVTSTLQGDPAGSTVQMKWVLSDKA